MYIKIKGNSFTENMHREIAAITDKAILRFRSVEYDETSQVIILPITRHKIKTKKKVLGALTPYHYDVNSKIQTLITIRNVSDCNIKCNLEDLSEKEITILFGLHINGHKISLYSAEEDRGEACYGIELNVSELDIEIADNREM